MLLYSAYNFTASIVVGLYEYLLNIFKMKRIGYYQLRSHSMHKGVVINNAR